MFELKLFHHGNKKSKFKTTTFVFYYLFLVFSKIISARRNFIITYTVNTTTTNWHTTQFIASSLRKYLKKKGFKLSKPEDESSFDHTVICARLLSKEIIEIRGTVTGTSKAISEKEIEEMDDSFREITHSILNLMFSPISFFNSVRGSDKNLCLCLPDTKQYRVILEKLEDYFVSHKLQLKIYLVNRSGSVSIFYINPAKEV